jgi:hypothetical protein
LAAILATTTSSPLSTFTWGQTKEKKKDTSPLLPQTFLKATTVVVPIQELARLLRIILLSHLPLLRGISTLVMRLSLRPVQSATPRAKATTATAIAATAAAVVLHR